MTYGSGFPQLYFRRATTDFMRRLKKSAKLQKKYDRSPVQIALRDWREKRGYSSHDEVYPEGWLEAFAEGRAKELLKDAE